MNVKYKPIALYILENYTDKIMTECGFKRRGNSLNYFRMIGSTKQKLDMAWQNNGIFIFVHKMFILCSLNV